METLRLRLSTQGRAGKTVTSIEGFTRERTLMDRLASELKHALGCGGSWRAGTVELQGDVRDRVRPRLERMGFRVRG
jgi:translation initiation factor 1